MEQAQIKIGILGLGYVGLPLALTFSEFFEVVGYDIDADRVVQLKEGKDRTREVDETVLATAQKGSLTITDQLQDLKACNYYIVTVPTPINKFKAPDLSYLLGACEQLGGVLTVGDTVIFESTVYPGCTEEECVPILQNISGLRYNEEFFVGYSPERINPGDKKRTLQTIVKVTSGSTPEVAQKVDNLYKTIITAGTHLAPSIKVAEAAKAIENAQRDVNISFVNELALIFDRMEIDTQDVLAAAGTKFNFLPFQPGLVGGHCISVDPYYLAHKASELGYHPEVILSGRRVNDRMGDFIAEKVVKLLIQRDFKIKGAKVLIMGITFKENCPDIRNTRVVDIIHALCDYGAEVSIYDPWASPKKVWSEYRLNLLTEEPEVDQYEAVVLAVAHQSFYTAPVKSWCVTDGVIFDAKAILNRDDVAARL